MLVAAPVVVVHRSGHTMVNRTAVVERVVAVQRTAVTVTVVVTAVVAVVVTAVRITVTIAARSPNILSVKVSWCLSLPSRPMAALV